MIESDLLCKLQRYNFPPLEEFVVHNLIIKLNIILPKEFMRLNKIANFEYFSYFDMLNLKSENDYSVIGTTLTLRKEINLPVKYVVFYYESAGLIIMETQDDPEKPTPIIYCNVYDVYNLIDNKPFEHPVDIFPSFTDFFEFLLTKEEEERGIIS